MVLPYATALLLGLGGCVGCDPPRPQCAVDAATCVADSAFPVGAVPNDVRLFRCGDTDVVLVPSSLDARLDVFALDGELVASTAFAAGDSPWAVVPVDDQRVAVTLFGARAVALVRPCAGLVLDQFVTSDVIEVTPPVALRGPVDVDGDGTEESEVTAMLPRAPEGLARAGDGQILVTYTNLLAAGLSEAEPPLFGPGALVALRVEGDAFVDPRTTTLPCTNPQAVVADGAGAWVSCSGPLGPDANGSQSALADGALVFVTSADLTVATTIDAGRFAPGTPAITDGALVVGSLVTPRVAVVPALAGAIDTDGVVLSLPGDDVDSVFEVVLFGGTALAPVFSRDRLYPIDVGARARIAGFDDGLAVGPGGAAFRGLLALDVSPTQLTVPAGETGTESRADAVALLGLSAEVAPLVLEGVLP